MYCRLLERGTQASTSAVTASTSGANLAYWSLLRGKSGPPTEAGRFVITPPNPLCVHAWTSILLKDLSTVAVLMGKTWTMLEKLKTEGELA